MPIHAAVLGCRFKYFSIHLVYFCTTYSHYLIETYCLSRRKSLSHLILILTPAHSAWLTSNSAATDPSIKQSSIKEHQLRLSAKSLLCSTHSWPAIFLLSLHLSQLQDRPSNHPVPQSPPILLLRVHVQSSLPPPLTPRLLVFHG